LFLARSGAIEGFEQLVASLGENPVTLMSEVDIAPADLRNPNNYVSYSKLAELLERAAFACGEPLFGLRLAARQRATVLGDLSITLSQLPNLGEALANTNRYLYLHARGARLNHISRGDDLRLELEISLDSPMGLEQLLQMSVGQLATFVTELLALRDPSFSILLRQPSPPAIDPGTGFASRVVFDKDIDGIQIPRQWLERRPRHDVEALQRHFQHHLQQLQQRYPDNLQDQVRHLIGQILASGECSIERVSAALDLHPRVLQKRLKRESSSYNQLLRETRVEIASQHLRYRTMSITDLALNLGYAEVSVFSRNFKQWTGLSPRQWQKAQEQQNLV
jgi:AraC-like DNA-binding protein